MSMNKLLFSIESVLTRIGEKRGLRFLTYNPITWTRFLVSARRNGKAFARMLVQAYPNVRQAVDVGAGTGGYVSRLREEGIAAIGVEYSSAGQLLARIQGVKLLPFDCADPEKCPKLKADLVFSIEVGEHLPESLSSVFVSYISGVSNFVIFSAAQPGQGGQGHVNEQPLEYWRALFNARGFKYCESEGETIVGILEEKGFRGCLTKNIQVFRQDAPSVE